MRVCILKERPTNHGVSMQETTATPSPFTLYKEGYIDGYEGRPPAAPNNTNYMIGYEYGSDDDVHDTPAKFSRDVS